MNARRYGGYLGIVLLLLAMMPGFLGWPRQQREDAVAAAVEVNPAALRANNRGIALMEQYRTEDALEAFEEAARQAPRWLPARINRGIALLYMTNADSSRERRCRAVLEQIVYEQPDNPHAHFCLGLLLMHQRNGREAIGHFESVLRHDPDDAYTWYWLATLRGVGSEEQIRCYRAARERNRHLGGALYGIAVNLREQDPAEAERLSEEYESLRERGWTNEVNFSRYGEAGPYAEVIATMDPRPRMGPPQRFHPAALNIQLAAGARWASAADWGASDVEEVIRRVRARFGATLLALDYNLDHKLDLFLAGAVIENGRRRDLLLRNDGGGRFTDVTAEAGLAEPRPTLGGVVADFDNDGHPDLLLTGAGAQKLFRNTGAGRFENVTQKAGLADLTSVCLGAARVDLDHDGASDLLLCEYAATVEQAVNGLRGARPASGLAVFLNSGIEQAGGPPDRRPALSCSFRRRMDVPGLKDARPGLVNLAVSDLDSDGDLDLLLLADGGVPAAVLNDRLLRFRQPPRPPSDAPAAAWNGAVVLDVDRDGRSDLLLVGSEQNPHLLRERTRNRAIEERPWFPAQRINAPPLRQAVAVDLDLDSWTDVLGVTAEGTPLWLRNQGGWLEATAAFREGPLDVLAAIASDLNGDERPDVILWTETRGLRCYQSEHNNNSALHVELSSREQRHATARVRCGTDGFGTRVSAHAGAIQASQEWTTLSASLGQSWQPLLLGLGPSASADVLRLRWADGTRQAERELPTDRLNIIERRQRRPFW